MGGNAMGGNAMGGDAMERGDGPMNAGNAFNLGLFASNCSGGLTMTKARERWDPSWDNNLQAERLKVRMISGLGTYPVVGSYNDVAETFRRLHDAGLDGIAIGMVNCIEEFPILRHEVVPRIEHLGLRRPAGDADRGEERSA